MEQVECNVFSHSTLQTIASNHCTECLCSAFDENGRLIGDSYCCQDLNFAEIANWTQSARDICRDSCISLCNRPENGHLTAHCCPPKVTKIHHSSCFPSSARVSLHNGKLVTMSELQLGDLVQTGREFNYFSSLVRSILN